MRPEGRTAATWRVILLGCVVGLLVYGCSRDAAGPSVRYDLIDSLPAARSSCDGFDLELGRDGEARRRLASGWSWTERSGDRQFAWSLGDRSTIEFPLLFPRPLRFEATALAWSEPAIDRRQEVQVVVNDVAVGRLRFESSGKFEQLETTVPRTALRRGLNRLELRYAFTRSQFESRGRDLAVAWNALRLSDVASGEPIACRREPANSPGESRPMRLQPLEVVEWRVELGSQERLLLVDVEQLHGDGLVVALATDDGALELLSDGAPVQASELEVPLLQGIGVERGFAPYRLLLGSRSGASFEAAWIVADPADPTPER